MTPSQAALLSQRAQHQLANGYCHCHVTAQQIAELSSAYLDAVRRLERIVELAERAQLDWCCNHRWSLRGDLSEILTLAQPLDTLPEV